MNEAISIRHLTKMALMIAVCAVCSQISLPLPFSPVPFTLQTLAVMLAALILGPLYGGLALSVYVLAGCLGLPVFAQGAAGLGVVAGPTGGFLMAFIPAAFLIPWLQQKLPFAKGWLKRLLACIIGLCLIYLWGMFWLHWQTGMGIPAAFASGVLPFLPLEAVKILLAVKISDVLAKNGLCSA